MKKQFLLFLLALMPMFALADDSGSCGNDVTFTFNEYHHKLTIQGTGDMTNYENSSEQPWYSYRELIATLTIEDGVTSIGDHAFDGCGLTSITIPNSVNSLGNYAFYNSDITSVTLPSSVTSVGRQAFALCEFLSSTTILGNITTLSLGMFGSCQKLTSVNIPNSVTSIERGVFEGCSMLTSIIIPNSVKTIGDRAFRDCGLTSITIPGSVSSIGERAFGMSYSLTTIVVDSNNSIYDSHEDCNAIIETASNTLIAGCQNSIIPNGVKTIGPFAFENCRILESITIPNSVTTIGANAFLMCSSLNPIVIPNSVVSIGEAAFRYCSRPTTITIPNSVKSIGAKAFDGWERLESVYSMIEEPFVIEDNTFDSYNKATLYVPAGTLEKYELTSAWNKFVSIEEQKETDGITTLQDKESKIQETFLLNGQKVNILQRGLNIVQMSDGSVKKVLK